MTHIKYLAFIRAMKKVTQQKVTKVVEGRGR